MSSSQTITILIAEDDALLMNVYKKKFSGPMYRLLTAADGEAALQLAKENKPDVIMLDVVMPKRNGFEVLKALKVDSTTASIPVIILSNLGEEGDVEKGKKLGAADYIVKANVTINQVVERVMRHVSSSNT
jgi:putative two-component system response regulator